MSDYPSDWKQAILGDVVSEIVAGQSPNRMGHPARHGKRGILKTTAIQWGEFSPSENLEALSDFSANDNTIVRKNDILITKAGPSHRVGVVALSHKDTDTLYVSGKMAAIRTTADTHPAFLAYLMSHDMFQGQLRSDITGMALSQTNITHENLLSKSIQFPPLPEQKKIAEILSGIDTEINCLKEQNDRCLRILLTISEDVFRNCKRKFPSQDLAQVCSVITKGATPTTFGYELSGIRFPGSVTFLGGGSTSDLGEFDQNPARYCTPEAVGTLKRSELRAGDTLITIVGASIGNTCQIPDYALPANINQNVALVRSNDSVLDCDYLSLYLKTEGRKALINIATTQAQPSVSLKQVGELQIPIPPTNEQRRISEAVTSIRDWKVQLDRKMHTMAHLKQALSSDLLSGRKRVSDARILEGVGI